MAKFSLELEFLVAGTYAPGRPATPPSYSSGGEPPEDPQVEVEELLSIGFTTWDASARKHSTTWLSLSRAAREELLTIIVNTPHLRDLAEGAIEEDQ